MADSANPVSPKVTWAGIGALLGPLLLTIGQAFVDLVSSSSGLLPYPWQTIATIAASIIGALIAAYAKNDPRRVKGDFTDEELAQLTGNESADPVP